jgi:branched-chain amino acid transport system substrate-binding protein
MHRTRTTWKMLALAVALLLLAACGEGGGQAGGVADPAPGADPAGDGATTDGAADDEEVDTAGLDGEPIVIGYIGALTGGSATMGEPGRNGIVLAVEEANADGGIDGRPIELVAFDDEADPARSVAGAQGFIRDGVTLVIGGPNSPTVLANREVLAEAGIPLLISIAQEDQLVDPDSATHATTFRVTEPNRVDVNVMAQFIDQQGCETIDILADDTAYGQGGAETISAVMEDVGVTVGQVVSHPPDTDDMTSEALNLQRSGADCIYVFSLGQAAALFFDAAEGVGLDVPTFGGRGLNQSSFLELVGDRDLNLTMPTVLNPDKPEMQDFIDRYSERFGSERWYMFAALGYDSGRTAIEALRRSGGESGEALVDAIESIDDLDATVGGDGSVISFGPDDHEGGAPDWVHTVTVRSGEFVLTDEQPEVDA